MHRCALALSLALAALALRAGAAEPPLRPLPPAAELAAAVTVRLVLAPGDTLQPWELGYRLEHGAEEGGTPVKRPWWRPLAAALATGAPTPAGQAWAVRVGSDEGLVVQRARPAGDWEVVVYLPPSAVRPQDGKYRLALASDLQRTRNTVQEVTTVPLRLDLDVVDERREGRRWELHLVGERELLEERTRRSLVDAEGERIRFRDLPAERVQDRTAAALHGGWYRTTARGGRLGRVDLGTIAGIDWEQDPLNFLDQRWKPYVGGSLRLTSEEVDDLRLELSLRLGGSFERFRIVETVVDEEGETVGQTVTVEENQLPTWQLVVAGRAPLYRLGTTTLLRVEAEGSWLQSFAKTGGGEGRPEKTERHAVLAGGLRFLTPLGASIFVHGKLATFDLPGEAGEKLEDFQWSSGVTAALQLAW